MLHLPQSKYKRAQFSPPIKISTSHPKILHVHELRTTVCTATGDLPSRQGSNANCRPQPQWTSSLRESQILCGHIMNSSVFLPWGERKHSWKNHSPPKILIPRVEEMSWGMCRCSLALISFQIIQQWVQPPSNQLPSSNGPNWITLTKPRELVSHSDHDLPASHLSKCSQQGVLVPAASPTSVVVEEAGP